MRVNAVAERMEAACHEHNQAIGQALHDRVFRAALQLISCGLPLNFALCSCRGSLSATSAHLGGQAAAAHPDGLRD